LNGYKVHNTVSEGKLVSHYLFDFVSNPIYLIA
jgi:hypothetical protein